MTEFEPSMNQIDDFTGNTISVEKNNLIRKVIFGLIIIGGIYAFAHHYFGTVEDQYHDVPYLLKRF